MTTTARLGGVRRGEGPPGSDAPVPVQPEGEAILRHLVDFIDAFMWQADTATLEIGFVTSSVGDLLGHQVSSWTGPVQRWSANIHAEDRDRVLACVRATGADGIDREVDFKADHADGRTFTLRLVVRLVAPPSGGNELWGITKDITGDARHTETLRDAQQRYRALTVQTARLRRQALEDPLTKLPNRLLLDDRARAVQRSAERAGNPFAVLLMDLDRFKEINDSYGHQAGDAVLREVALRIRICLRAQDTPARLGGDEFAALLPETDEAGARRVAERIARAMTSPVEVDGVEHAIGISIGIALYPSHSETVEGLLAAADVAMYRAKDAGGGAELATEDAAIPLRSDRRLHRKRRGHPAVGLAAGIAIFAAALSPMAGHRSTQSDSASKLASATAALEIATDDQVVDVVAGTEMTLADISLSEVAVPEVASALDRLHRTLDGLKSGVPAALVERVDRLIATVREAELVAQLSASPAPAPMPSAVLNADPDKVPKPKASDPPKVPRPTPEPAISDPTA